MLFDINDSILGKAASIPDKHDASLLFRIPRVENREHYGIEDKNLPFVGYDVWNCYELSFLTDNGLPVSRVMKLIYSAGSQFLVESKSLKVYLNSFNMETFGQSVAEAEKRVADIITYHLTDLLETQVSVILFDGNSCALEAFPQLKNADLISQITQTAQDSLLFTRFTESPDLLRGEKTNSVRQYAFRTDLLRSNCRVTNQPDWGDLFVEMSTAHEVDLASVLLYLVSFRKENHFHEEVVEMIYKRFKDAFETEKLMVAAMYTRRGGIDINPIRASHTEMLDRSFISSERRLAKTLRQ